KLGWSIWMFCACSLIAFLAVAANRLSRPASMARLGLTISVVGCGFDLLCDSVYILAFPLVANWGRSPEIFLTAERPRGIASLVLATGASSIGTLLIAGEMRRQRCGGMITYLVGLGVAGFGLVLAAAGFTNEPRHVEVATSVTMLFFFIWVIL